MREDSKKGRDVKRGVLVRKRLTVSACNSSGLPGSVAGLVSSAQHGYCLSAPGITSRRLGASHDILWSADELQQAVITGCPTVSPHPW
jgi:hypothetical protein